MNCISSSSSLLLPTLFPPCNFSNNSTKSQLSPVFASSKITGSYDVNTASFEDEAPGTPVPSIGADSDKMAPKQKIRIKLSTLDRRFVQADYGYCKDDQCNDHGSNKEENI